MEKWIFAQNKENILIFLEKKNKIIFIIDTSVLSTLFSGEKIIKRMLKI